MYTIFETTGYHPDDRIENRKIVATTRTKKEAIDIMRLWKFELKEAGAHVNSQSTWERMDIFDKRIGLWGKVITRWIEKMPI